MPSLSTHDEAQTPQRGRVARSRRCGHVAILGRSNVGKSTLLNRLVGAKLSSVASKPQTTRHNITGILTEHGAQVIFVDTPGIHLNEKHLLNKLLNKAAQAALQGVDLVLFLLECERWGEVDAHILDFIRDAAKPCVACVTKVDRLKNKQALLPALAELGGRHAFEELLPISSTKGTNLEPLKAAVRTRLPVGEYLYPQDQVSNRSTRFLMAEQIREQLVRSTQDELPYSVYVEIEDLEEGQDRIWINALIWVDRPSQRAIVIGRQGRTLKAIGTQARANIARFSGKEVVLKLWVKDKAGWQDNPSVLAGFESEVF
jgi:GTP-binding protein Era